MASRKIAEPYGGAERAFRRAVDALDLLIALISDSERRRQARRSPCRSAYWFASCSSAHFSEQ